MKKLKLATQMLYIRTAYEMALIGVVILMAYLLEPVMNIVRGLLIGGRKGGDEVLWLLVIFVAVVITMRFWGDWMRIKKLKKNYL